MAISFRRPSLRSKFVFIPVLLFTLGFLHFIIQNQYQIKNTLSYATRPLWDAANGPKQIIPHYYAEGMNMDSHACQLHGWKERDGKDGIKVMDAVLMSSELDLLEIRMNELDSVVDHFFIIESNATFTGLSKETYFAKDRGRFSKFEKKIVYNFLPGYPLRSGESAWDVEAATRNAMTALLRTHIRTLPQNTQTLVLMSDIDEIPARHTVELLKTCDFGSSIHLQLRNFLYSFEWQLDMSSWRASVHLWRDNVYYRHSKSGDLLLADSGWHCSYCFRTIPEYIVKMKGFSHSDRIGGNMKLLDTQRIQETICRGKDIFGMLPEAYSYLDLLSQMSLEPLTSAVGLPRFLIDNAERFRFLLPGGCRRED
ncbi:Beta-1,4-mannosyl-glycoprotein 4-beta-N-acetylglucosaminyltransferase [Hypsizygus marmoreus]|uniref:Beta-1,4-mannosyl-glycoprotein 4-beta-N-acetylglucosaminyltransferase n=1 Tax=Hypsizygus marmoreus TaxID=39966 RepID=A0A369JVR3_HYPMA|nr:Beta-1,4-mannosyl-glycoprotein 4-beta-N-acetylglucosaminyltransferase [Hypsizygus marmoreus]